MGDSEGKEEIYNCEVSEDELETRRASKQKILSFYKGYGIR